MNAVITGPAHECMGEADLRSIESSMRLSWSLRLGRFSWLVAYISLGISFILRKVVSTHPQRCGSRTDWQGTYGSSCWDMWTYLRSGLLAADIWNNETLTCSVTLHNAIQVCVHSRAYKSGVVSLLALSECSVALPGSLAIVRSVRRYWLMIVLPAVLN
jgi:hypothetical protein